MWIPGSGSGSTSKWDESETLMWRISAESAATIPMLLSAKAGARGPELRRGNGSSCCYKGYKSKSDWISCNLYWYFENIWQKFIASAYLVFVKGISNFVGKLAFESYIPSFSQSFSERNEHAHQAFKDHLRPLNQVRWQFKCHTCRNTRIWGSQLPFQSLMSPGANLSLPGQNCGITM